MAKKKSKSLLGSKLNLSKKQLGTLLSALIILGVGATYWFATHAATSPKNPFMLKGSESGLCLAASGTSNSAPVQLATCDSRYSGRKWSYYSDGTLRNAASGRCLDVYGQGTANGTKVDIYDCVGTANQSWKWGSGSSIINTGSGRVLDAVGHGTSSGTRIQIWDFLNGKNQSWPAI